MMGRPRKWFLAFVLLAAAAIGGFLVTGEHLVLIGAIFAALLLSALMVTYRRIAERLAKLSVRERDSARQTQATIWLAATIRPRAPMPAPTAYTLQPDMATAIYSMILADQPDTILELGSGLSTLVIGYALDRAERGRLISLEHDAEHAARGREAVRQHGLEHRVQVRHAPLAETTTAQGAARWYESTAIEELGELDMVLVDGPPASIGRHARYPAMEKIFESLRPGAVVILDDAKRPEERKIAERWAEEFPALRLDWLPTSRGAAILTRT